MKSIRKLWIPLLMTIMIVSTFAVTVNAVTAGTLGLFDAVDNDHEMIVQKGLEPAGWPYFTLKVKITDVTDAVGVVFSVRWNSTLFDLADANITVPGSADHWLYPTGSGGIGSPMKDHLSAGELGEWIQMQLSPFSAKSFNSTSVPVWGWVASLTFKYIGPSPPIGGSIDSNITIVDVPGETCNTAWTPDGSNWNDFTDLLPFHFNYWATWGPVASPVASKTHSPALVYEGDHVIFDGTGSTPGKDGDEDCPITQWWWDFGDGNSSWLDTVGVVGHTYPTAGDYLVVLYVIAPGIPPNIHPTYNNQSAPTSQTVSVRVPALTGIDVYTEDFRWPFYMAKQNGTGPDQNADAFRPQENIDLYAYVFYNDDAVQNKLVKFYITGPDNPYGRFFFTRTAYSSNGTVWNGTDWIPMPDGVAWIAFRVPWPCEYAQQRIFGKWNVTVQVALPDVKPGEETIYEDTMQFCVCWGVQIDLVELLNATGDPVDAMKKCQTITIKVTLTNCYMLPRWACVAFAIYDDVGTIIGYAHISTYVDPEVVFCTPGRTVVNVTIHIPKWAYVGTHGMVYVNAYTDWPWVPTSAEPWCPEIAVPLEILKA